MATVQKIERKYGPTWRVAICVNGVRKTGTFDSKAKALTWAEEVEALLRSGLPLPGETGADDLDIKEAVEKYTMAVAPRKKVNTRRLDQEIGGRILNYFGGKTLRGVKREDVAAYRDYRLQAVGPSSVIQDLSFLRCMYRMARVEWGKDVTDPTTDIRKPSAPKHRLALLSPKQIDRLLDWCCISKQEKLFCYVLLLLHSAMRPSEGAGLQWSQVLFDQGILDLTETKTEPRRVPMTSTIATMLSKMQKEHSPDNPFVFLPNDGKTRNVPSKYFRHAFETACAGAGIQNFTLYGLRHSAASYLIMHGVDIRTVAEIMGHRNISQTMKYTHFLDAHKVAAINAIDRLGR